MKAYVGNKAIILAEPEVKEEVDGYSVIYSDGSETWLTKEILEFDFREVTDSEISIVIDSVTEDSEQDDLDEVLSELVASDPVDEPVMEEGPVDANE